MHNSYIESGITFDSSEVYKITMRFLILNTDYPEFLQWLHLQHPGLERLSYNEQMKTRNESLFSTADFYSSNLRKLGHDALDIHANNERMQRAWASEQGMEFERSSTLTQKYKSMVRRSAGVAAKTPLRYLGSLVRGKVSMIISSRESWFYEILAAQIKQCKPDILLNLDMGGISSRFLREMKPNIRLLVGQHAATRFSDAKDFSCYDLVTSSFPPTVEYFREKGIPAELNRLAFEPKVLSFLKTGRKNHDVTFVGSFFPIHRSREALLETICTRFPRTRVWGPSIGHLRSASPIRRCYEGQAWGVQMFQVLHDSRITFNHHGEVAPYANNMRLYEATGVGSLLITDWKENLGEMFEPGKEVVAYRTTEECVEMVKYYLEHEEERKAIASAGQERTLREHTYYQRTKELAEILQKHMGRSKKKALE